ncbi:RNA polymerase sigma-70 factor [Paraflavitalea sp. CAU 1676]|uniref:RNA polymerase sigma-70 factor n=1 Tax=Paraflavitalea sp. CAU 1676 TaxID=3032598 RepID=UPI0023DBE1C6|nr:RNA polymerase sigma-70 factor [Paraflavitalea sp. CAU 1676]MDF2191472.1 RNA polymerase sigma-70 factor [Paraflavitalea sp. CAU 1676]
MEQWQQGDERSFEQLYHQHALPLLKIAVQKTDDREVAKELVQTVFVTLYQNKAGAHKINSLQAYLYTMLKNKLLDHYRHLLVQKKFHLQSTNQYERVSNNDVESYVDTRELENRLGEEVAKLPPQCQTVFRMRREQEMSNKEIATTLNISENTVEQHMRKAIRLLREALNISKKALFFLL